jgi:hypothetical protein
VTFRADQHKFGYFLPAAITNAINGGNMKRLRTLLMLMTGILNSQLDSLSACTVVMVSKNGLHPWRGG